MARLSIFLTNLGRYNEGVLDGEWVRLPITEEKYRAVLKRIHIDGERYEEVFITDCDCDFADIDCFGEYEKVERLNRLAELVDDMTDSEVEIFKAAQELDEPSGVEDLINIALNLDDYLFNSDIKDEYDLGVWAIEEEGEDIPEWVKYYIDYKSYGETMIINGEGVITSEGYCCHA